MFQQRSHKRNEKVNAMYREHVKTLIENGECTVNAHSGKVTDVYLHIIRVYIGQEEFMKSEFMSEIKSILVYDHDSNRLVA